LALLTDTRDRSSLPGHTDRGGFWMFASPCALRGAAER